MAISHLPDQEDILFYSKVTEQFMSRLKGEKPTEINPIALEGDSETVHALFAILTELKANRLGRQR